MAISPRYLSVVRGFPFFRPFFLPLAASPFLPLLRWPAVRPHPSAGNDSTSVGPVFFRNRSFIPAIFTSLTKQIVTAYSFTPNSFFTRRKNVSRGFRANRTFRCWFTIMLADFLYPVLSRFPRPPFPPCRSRLQPLHSPRAGDAPRHSPHKPE